MPIAKTNRNKRSRKMAVVVHIARLLPSDPNFGLPVICYVCDAPHNASGAARIDRKGSGIWVPVCDACLADDKSATNAIVRKFWNAPNMEISEGGKLTTEQFAALADRPDKPEH